MGSLLYLSFFMLEFFVAMLDHLRFTLVVTAMIIECLSFFVPSMYYMIVHHRVFMETESSIAEVCSESDSKR